MNFKKLTTAVAFAIGLGAATCANAVELKYASAAPSNSPWAKMIDALVQTAAAKSGGSLEIKTFLNSQLGDEATAIQQVARGRIDMGGFSLTATSIVVPELGLLNAPFLWDSTAQAECALDNHLASSLQPYFEERGLVNIGWGEAGYQRIFAAKPIQTAADFDALKMRVSPSKGSVGAFKAVKANGVVLPVTEINSALQTGLVDAAELNITFGIITGAGKLAPVVTKTDHVYLPSLTLVSKRSFDKLTEAEQEALSTSVVPAPKQRATVRGVEATLVKRLTDAGGVVTEMPDAERAKLRDQMVQSWPALVENSGKHAAEVWGLIQDAKAACTG